MAFRYEARVRIEGGVEETQFAKLDSDAPRIPSRYVSDEKEFGKYANGRTYRINPERIEAEVEVEMAEVQAEVSKEEAKSMKVGSKGSKK